MYGDHDQEELEGYGEVLFNETIRVVMISHNVEGDVKLERRWRLRNFTLLIQEFRDLPCMIAECHQRRCYASLVLRTHLTSRGAIKEHSICYDGLHVNVY
jgi:hypothetical protein